MPGARRRGPVTVLDSAAAQLLPGTLTDVRVTVIDAPGRGLAARVEHAAGPGRAGGATSSRPRRHPAALDRSRRAGGPRRGRGRAPDAHAHRRRRRRHVRAGARPRCSRWRSATGTRWRRGVQQTRRRPRTRSLLDAGLIEEDDRAHGACRCRCSSSQPGRRCGPRRGRGCRRRSARASRSPRSTRFAGQPRPAGGPRPRPRPRRVIAVRVPTPTSRARCRPSTCSTPRPGGDHAARARPAVEQRRRGVGHYGLGPDATAVLPRRPSPGRRRRRPRPRAAAGERS